MQAQQYAVNHYPIQSIITWIKSGDIAIPEIQRPFVWDATDVRDLIDSMFQGYPVGFMIAWRNPNVKLKDGSSSAGKRILIDGQQRVTAIMTAMLGQDVINKNYQRGRIRIAFHPQDYRFEVTNPVIQKDSTWIPDIAVTFSPEIKVRRLAGEYCAKNPQADEDAVYDSIERLQGIVNNDVGLIELNSDLDIEVVTEIFRRVNSKGTVLDQADFAMSKIASNETYGGSTLRKAIDYFCHLAIAPDFFHTLKEHDREFASTEYFQRMSWLRNETDDIYDPKYTDMLRVAFASEFQRGRLGDLVALLSGRNFETKQYEEPIAEASFAQLKQGVLNFINETHFLRFVMIIRSAGFVDSSLIGSQMALNFAYILYLTLRAQKRPEADIQRAVRRWFVMSVLRGRYSASPESAIDNDIRQIYQLGFDQYASAIEKAELSDAFWDSLLPQEMVTSSGSSPYFRVFQSAQVKLNDKGFLSRDITVQDLIKNKSDAHHLFPRNYLKKIGLTRGQYNQIANYAITQSEINIAIGDRPPSEYFQHLQEQCHGGPQRYGAITDPEELHVNLRMHCIPDGVEKMTVDDYDAFLQERRQLMAAKIKQYYNIL